MSGDEMKPVQTAGITASVDREDSGTTPVVLLTTADMHAHRETELVRLVNSVEKFRQQNPNVPVHHVMLLQRCSDASAIASRLGFPDKMDVFGDVAQIPLSKARNIMLNRLFRAPPFPLRDALVAFPDDDAWYPDGTLAHIHSLFDTDAELDLWFCRYGSLAECPAAIRELSPSLAQVIARASSNTIALRGAVLRKIRGFDENLGLGTSARSGEDTDFAVRAALNSRKIRHAPLRMIGHRDFDPAIRAKYYGGTLVALGRHKWESLAAFFAFGRKILVGIALVLRRDLKFAQFREAWKMYFSNQPSVNPEFQ